MISDQRYEEIREALEQVVRDMPLLSETGAYIRWSDGTPCAVMVVQALEMLEKLRAVRARQCVTIK